VYWSRLTVNGASTPSTGRSRPSNEIDLLKNQNIKRRSSMTASQIYILLSVAILVIVSLLVFFISGRKKEDAFTPMTILALGFILTGILYSNDRWFSYSLMGIGVVLAIVDMLRKISSFRKEP
jgi:K+ transporter